MNREKHEDCPGCGQPWQSQAAYDSQRCEECEQDRLLNQLIVSKAHRMHRLLYEMVNGHYSIQQFEEKLIEAERLLQEGLERMPDDKALGLYKKFVVYRADGSRKHHNCQYFVIDITHDDFARPALLAYADACESEFPKLAADLRKQAEYT